MSLKALVDKCPNLKLRHHLHVCSLLLLPCNCLHRVAIITASHIRAVCCAVSVHVNVVNVVKAGEEKMFNCWQLEVSLVSPPSAEFRIYCALTLSFRMRIFTLLLFLHQHFYLIFPVFSFSAAPLDTIITPFVWIKTFCLTWAIKQCTANPNSSEIISFQYFPFPKTN